jgi:plastocyanin
MTGQLTVVDKSQAADTQQQVKANADKQQNDYVAKLKALVDASGKATADRAQAGVISSDPPSFQATLFAPKEISIPVGGSVSWTIFGPHTISFNVPQDAVGLLSKGADGTVSTNLKAFGPTGGPGQPPPPAPGSPGGPSPTVVDAGAWDGKGFHSTGLFRPAPPALFAYKLTFTQAGTYPFRCVIHTDMEGTVKVGQ